MPMSARIRGPRNKATIKSNIARTRVLHKKAWCKAGLHSGQTNHNLALHSGQTNDMNTFISPLH